MSFVSDAEHKEAVRKAYQEGYDAGFRAGIEAPARRHAPFHVEPYKPQYAGPQYEVGGIHSPPPAMCRMNMEPPGFPTTPNGSSAP